MGFLNAWSIPVTSNLLFQKHHNKLIYPHLPQNGERFGKFFPFCQYVIFLEVLQTYYLLLDVLVFSKNGGFKLCGGRLYQTK